MAASLRLRDSAEADLPVFYEQQNDAEANRMAAFSARSREDFFKHWTTKVLAQEGAVAKTIVVGEAVVGYVSSWEQDGKRFVGYWIGRGYWGRGFATRALSEFLRLLKTRPLYAFVVGHHSGSIRVLEKCGFKECERGRFFSELHGHEVDECLMVLI